MGTKNDESKIEKKEVRESIRLLIELIADESVRTDNCNQSNVTICMVPATLRNLNATAYTPRITSIGPLHNKDQRLRAMEDHKVTYMYRLFCRTVNSKIDEIDQVTNQCVQAVFELLPRARACYALSLHCYDDIKLAEMMVIDGCFILELLYRSEHGIAEGDPILDNILVKHDVKHDLLLLENQLPFFILKALFSITVERIQKSTSPQESTSPQQSTSTLTALVFSFFNDMNILNDSELTTFDQAHCHILGLLQSCYRPIAKNRDQVPNVSYSATEIAGAGVTFKAQKDEFFPLAVKLKQSPLVPGLGTLFVRETCFEIPVLSIKDLTPSFLRNLIAYEQCYQLSHHYVTSFAFLMDKLIDSKDDVSLLVRSKVLQHNLGAMEDVTNLFNNICKGVVVRDFYYSKEWRQLDEYCNRFGPRILISLRRLFRSTTWKTLSVIAAVILFALTFVQTIYTVGNV